MFNFMVTTTLHYTMDKIHGWRHSPNVWPLTWLWHCHSSLFFWKIWTLALRLYLTLDTYLQTLYTIFYVIGVTFIFRSTCIIKIGPPFFLLKVGLQKEYSTKFHNKACLTFFMVK